MLSPESVNKVYSQFLGRTPTRVLPLYNLLTVVNSPTSAFFKAKWNFAVC